MTFFGPSIRNGLSLGLGTTATLANNGALAPSLDLIFAGASTLPSDVTFTRASSGTYFNSAGVLTTAAVNEARFDYNPSTLVALGLLIEEQRTNSIRNNTMQGAVAGTPGTLPTNWTGNATLDGVSREVVATGTTNGITWIDIRLSGTSSTGGTQIPIAFDGVTQVAALQNQTWTPSVFLSVSGGSLTNINALTIRHRYYNSVGTALTAQDTSVLSSISGTLTRYNGNAFTATGATTAYTMSMLALDYVNSSAIDITLRIGMPQLEQGAFATSVIPTTNAAVTRSADAATMTGTNFSNWYNATEGTFFCVSQKEYSGSSAFPRILQVSDATNNNAIILLWSESSSRLYAAVNNGGVLQADIGNNGLSQTAAHKSAFTYKVNDFAISNDGATAVVDLSGTIPTVNRLIIGNDVNVSYLNGWISRISYYPRRLSDAELQAITA